MKIAKYFLFLLLLFFNKIFLNNNIILNSESETFVIKNHKTDEVGSLKKKMF